MHKSKQFIQSNIASDIATLMLKLSGNGLLNLYHVYIWSKWIRVQVKGSFTLGRERKRHRFQMGSYGIQFDVNTEQPQISKKKIRFRSV